MSEDRSTALASVPVKTEDRSLATAFQSAALPLLPVVLVDFLGVP